MHCTLCSALHFMPAGQRQRAVKKQEKLGSLVANQLQQLRLACTHPQITAFWKELQSELQVEVRRCCRSHCRVLHLHLHTTARYLRQEESSMLLLTEV